MQGTERIFLERRYTRINLHYIQKLARIQTHTHLTTHTHTSPFTCLTSCFPLYPFIYTQNYNIPVEPKITLILNPFSSNFFIPHILSIMFIMLVQSTKSISPKDNVDTGDILSCVDFPRTPRKLVRTLFKRQNRSLVRM